MRSSIKCYGNINVTDILKSRLELAKQLLTKLIVLIYDEQFYYSITYIKNYSETI